MENAGQAPYNAPMTAFLKMHGLGHDFVVFDARDSALALSPARARPASGDWLRHGGGNAPRERDDRCQPAVL
jgi:hypothetical protein